MFTRIAMHAVAAGLVLAAQAATAAPLPFTATLRLEIGNLPPVVATGAGTADVTPGTGAFQVPAGVMNGLQGTFPITPPAFGIAFGAAVGTPGLVGQVAPFAGGSNQKLTWSGNLGSSPLAASLYFLNAKNKAMVAIPLACIGGAFDLSCPPGGLPGFPTGTIVGDVFRLGMQTVSGNFPGAAQLEGTGFDNRDAGGLGVIQMVSPNRVDLGSIGDIPILATYTFTFVPEPATAVLIGAALVGLAAVRSRR